jgi:hypothetical protein
MLPRVQAVYDGDPSDAGFAEPRPSPYANGLFRIQIHLERDYPMSAPKVRAGGVLPLACLPARLRLSRRAASLLLDDILLAQIVRWRGARFGVVARVRLGPPTSVDAQHVGRFGVACLPATLQVRFLTKIWHPNVDYAKGEPCVDLLGTTWKSDMTIRHILQTIRGMMAFPNSGALRRCTSGCRRRVHRVLHCLRASV